MKPLKKYLLSAGGLAIATLVRQWMGSLRYQGAFYDPTLDPAGPRFSGPALFIFWHEYIPFMFYLRGHCQTAMLVSQHKDAELLSRAAGIMGFDLVRGSSRRGGLTALRIMMQKGKAMNLTMTPDGPRGPRRTLAPGCLYVASKLGMPLVPLGLGYDHPWRNTRAWDHFAIPRPGSRACAVIGPAIYLPAHLDREALEVWRKKIEAVLNRLTETAENWASTGQPLVGARPLHRAPRPLGIFRTPNAPASLSSSRSTDQPDGTLLAAA